MDDRNRRHDRIRKRALQDNGGSDTFVRWKQTVFDEVFGLARDAPRLSILEARLFGELELIYSIRMPAPRPPSRGQLVIDHSAVFHLIYHESWLLEPIPGWAPLGLLKPRDLFHPNGSGKPSMRGAICLGGLMPGVTPKELILLGYYLVSLQDLTLDELDPAGVLNAPACEFYRCHPEYLPLTRAGLLDDWSP